MASGEQTAEERSGERRDYLAQRFPRVSPARLPIGQLSGFEEPPGEPMRLFAPGPRALEAFRLLWNGEERLPLRLELECGHALPDDPPDNMVLRVACQTCGADVRLHLVEAL